MGSVSGSGATNGGTVVVVSGIVEVVSAIGGNVIGTIIGAWVVVVAGASVVVVVVGASVVVVVAAIVVVVVATVVVVVAGNVGATVGAFGLLGVTAPNVTPFLVVEPGRLSTSKTGERPWSSRLNTRKPRR